jgi:hypothetical protein
MSAGEVLNITIPNYQDPEGDNCTILLIQGFDFTTYFSPNIISLAPRSSEQSPYEIIIAITDGHSPPQNLSFLLFVIPNTPPTFATPP